MSDIEIKAIAFDKIVKIIDETDSYWDCEVKSAYGEIDTIVSIAKSRLRTEEDNHDD